MASKFSEKLLRQLAAAKVAKGGPRPTFTNVAEYEADPQVALFRRQLEEMKEEATPAPVRVPAIALRPVGDRGDFLGTSDEEESPEALAAFSKAAGPLPAETVVKKTTVIQPLESMEAKKKLLKNPTKLVKKLFGPLE
jgi:hypothetical protein